MGINIPFKVDDLDFSYREAKLRDAEKLRTFQEIENSLHSIAGSLKVISEQLSNKKTKGK